MSQTTIDTGDIIMKERLVLQTDTFLFDDLTTDVSEKACDEIIRFLDESDIIDDGSITNAIYERLEDLTPLDSESGGDLLALFYGWLNSIKDELKELGAFTDMGEFRFSNCRLLPGRNIEFYRVGLG